LLVDYSSVILNEITDVNLEKGVEVTVNDITTSYNKLTTAISEKEATDIAIAVLEEAKKDEKINEIINSFLELVGETEYSFDETIQELKDSKETASDEDSLQISIYVDSNGSLEGADIVILDESENYSLSYIAAKKGEDSTSTLKLLEGETELSSIVTEWVESSNGYTGTMDITVNIEDEYVGNTTTTINVEFEDVKYVDKENGTANGTFTITSDSFAGTAITFTLVGEKDSQKMDVSINVMGMDIGTLSVDYGMKEYETIEFPSDNATQYDLETQMEEYSSTIDINTLLEDLNNKLGFDISSFFY